MVKETLDKVKQQTKEVDWKSEYEKKQKEAEQYIAEINTLKANPVVDQVIEIANEFLEKLKQIQI